MCKITLFLHYYVSVYLYSEVKNDENRAQMYACLYHYVQRFIVLCITQTQDSSNTIPMGLEPTAVTVSPGCYTPEVGSYQLLELPNPIPNVH